MISFINQSCDCVKAHRCAFVSRLKKKMGSISGILEGAIYSKRLHLCSLENANFVRLLRLSNVDYINLLKTFHCSA